MRPDELSALAAIDLLEMMFKSGVIAVRRLARSIDEVFRDAVCRLQDFLSQAKVTFSRSDWHPQGVPNSKRGNGRESQARSPSCQAKTWSSEGRTAWKDQAT
jgi:hypothetical protein